MPELNVEHRIVRKQATEQRRVRSATRMAILAVAVHLLASAVAFGWYYVVVPRWKMQFADFDTELPEIAVWVITLSDAFVNYWFVAAFPLPFLAVVDYVIMRWMTQQLGLRWTGACILGLALAILTPVAIHSPCCTGQCRAI